MALVRTRGGYSVARFHVCRLDESFPLLDSVCQESVGMHFGQVLSGSVMMQPFDTCIHFPLLRSQTACVITAMFLRVKLVTQIRGCSFDQFMELFVWPVFSNRLF